MAPALPCLESGCWAVGRGVTGRRRSKDWARFGIDGSGNEEPRETRGDGNLLEAVIVAVAAELEEEEEEDDEDKYLEVISLALGFLGRGATPLSFSEGRRGRLDGLWWWVWPVVGFGLFWEGVPEMAATMIRDLSSHFSYSQELG